MSLDESIGEKYCAACGSALEVKEVQGKPRPVCVNCQRVVYHDPKIAATCVVARRGKILMIQRDTPVGRGLWSMPGGYIDRGEVVEDGAAREVLEETGLQVEVQGLVGLFSEAGNPVVVAAFAARETGGSLKAGPEAQDVGFFPLGKLPPLAFPRDQLILNQWRELSGRGR
ncbi:MAG: DNA mismatch repair protein MutT [SAR202 cluster bacterium Io17-Chloro-G9]|nr:MAG: DNA mismatch repair protein MutT [SAR202 cluster bacterium Io17-Chloro-G9]